MSFFIWLALFLLSEALRPAPDLQDVKASELDEFNFPTAKENRPEPLVWGTVRIGTPNVAWYGDLLQDPITQEIQYSLFNSIEQIIGFKYSIGIQFGLCRGADDSCLLKRIWIGEVEIYSNPTGLSEGFIVGLSKAVVDDGGTGYSFDDILTVNEGTASPHATLKVTAESGGVVTAVEIVTPGDYSVNPVDPTTTTVAPAGGTGCTLTTTFTGRGPVLLDDKDFFGGEKLGNGGILGNFAFFPGSLTQPASTYLTGFQLEGGDTPAYVGSCHLVWERGYLGNSSSIEAWAFEIQRIPTGLGVADSVVNGEDAGLAHVAYEVLTNIDWGLATPVAKIDVANFQAAASTLKDEGNGFSYEMTSKGTVESLFNLLNEQMNGRIFLNKSTGQWQIKLARNDYLISALPLLDETNVKEVRNFSRGSWFETTNQVVVPFVDRAQDYKGTSALAQDPANQRTQNRVIPTSITYLGVKDATLANNIAWRDLRTLSFPLAKVTLVVTRASWALIPVSVVKWTDPELGITELVMRVLEVDLGQLRSDDIVLTLVQDIFAELPPSFDSPFGTGWTPLADTLVAVPADEQIIIEAPRAILKRDPNLVGSPKDKIWVGWRTQAGEPKVQILERNSSGTPSGDFSPAGEVYGAFLIGGTFVALSPAANTSTITIVPTPDTQVNILDKFSAAATLQQMGVNLQALLMIEDEFILVGATAINGANIDLTGCYRGVLDSVQKDHAAGTKVYLISISGNLTNTTFPAGNNVHIKLLPNSLTDELLEASATQITVDLDNRLRRPYPPEEPDVNGTVWPTGTISLDDLFSGGSTEDEKGLELAYVRRDFRTEDEVAAIVDEASLLSDFPTANTTEYEVEVRDDPDGGNTLLATIVFGTQQNDYDITRTKILRELDGVIPSRMRLVVKARHTFETVVFGATEDLVVDFDTASTELASLFNLTSLAQNEVSPILIATDTGTYTFTIGTALAGGDVEAQINGGGFVSVITSGTSGTLPGVTAGDDIEVRHTDPDSSLETQLLIDDAGSTTIAQGILEV